MMLTWYDVSAYTFDDMVGFVCVLLSIDKNAKFERDYREKSPHLKQRQSAGSFKRISIDAISGVVSRVPSGS